MAVAFSSIHARIEEERKRALPEARKVIDFRNYARGKQKGTLTPFQLYILRGLIGKMFCDNVCKKVLGELRNRLKMSRYDVADQQVLEFLRELWVKNKIPRLASQIHWAALRDGNTAVGLDFTDRVVLTRERWWNGRFGIFVAYDDADEPTYAVKDWQESSQRLRTVWFPDHIERYVASGNGWQPRRLSTDPPEGTITWTDEAGQPLGIPFVHFANLQVPNDGTGDDNPDEPDAHYGLSELDGGLLGLQDEINDVHRDLTASGRYVGFQMMYATGISAKKEDGTDKTYRPEPGAFFTDTNKDAKFGTLPPGEITQLEKLLNIKLQAVSRQSGIPMHLITGDWPSGEALLRSEMPMIDKVETIGTAFGPAWSSVAYKAVRMLNARGSGGLNAESLVSTVFEPASKRDPLTQAIVAEKRAPFVSVKETLRLLGYSEQDADRIILEMLDEQKRGVPREGVGQGANAVRPSEAGSDQGRSPSARDDGKVRDT